ncbi:hypothetical protein BLNAU_15888 [Blattamonas nauphoetae]|uniref:Uncharacterized protein n=1 Tax=Blattamonas nauphoetae TaxID=2049346 RepID=A0ABQ9X9D8_9EUKA|nr:hypothetical protein BLNAU_15888 [Blattamonas nauphoetae]
MPKWMEAMLPLRFPRHNILSPPLEDYFIKPKQATSPAKPKKAVAKALLDQVQLLLHPNRLHRRVQREGHSQPGVSLPQSPIDQRPAHLCPIAPKAPTNRKCRNWKTNLGSCRECFNEQPRQLRLSHAQPDRGHRPACHYNSRKRRNQQHRQNRFPEQLGVGVSTMVLSDIDRQFEEEERRLREQKEGKAVDFKIQASSTMMNEIDRQFEEEERHLQAEEKQRRREEQMAAIAASVQPVRKMNKLKVNANAKKGQRKSSNYLEDHAMMEAKASDVKNGADRVRRLLLGEDEQKDLDEGPCGVKIVRRGEGMNRIKQLHNKNKVDDKKQREYEEKLQQLELEKKAQAGDKPWLTRGKSKEEKALEEEKRRIEQEMKDDEEAERWKVVKEAQMKERETRDAERKAFQKLIAKKKKKQNRSHSVGDEEDVVILVAPNRKPVQTTETVEQKKEEVSIDVEVLPAQATPKKAAAASKEGSPQATHTPPKIGSSKGKVERKEKRSENVQRSSPFANVERGE